MSGRLRRPTIADVAARSGVSTATVSRVLSGSTPAHPDTRERVLDAVSALGYHPSGVARALKRSETRTIGLLVTDIGNPFFPQIVRSVEDEAHALGYAVLLCNAADDPDRELAYLDLLVERRVDGLVVASARTSRRHADRIDAIPMPVVLVNAAAADGRNPSIAVDHRLGARRATEHLLELGHRRIGHITAPFDRAAAAEARLAGVTDALRAAGVGPETLVVVEGDERVEGGVRAAQLLLAERPGPTAIVCYNDLTAVGAVRAARASAVSVPGQVSIVGFDDIEAASWIDPPLTTVRQPTDEMGRWAVARLARALKGEALPDDPVVTLEPELVVRGSTGPPPGHGTV